MTSKERLTVNVSKAEFQELRAMAETLNVSMAWLGREAISRFLEQHKQQELQFPLNIDQKPRARA